MTLTKEKLESIFKQSIHDEGEKTFEILKQRGTTPIDVLLKGVATVDVCPLVEFVAQSDYIKDYITNMVSKQIMATIFSRGETPSPSSVAMLGLMLGLIVGRALGQTEALEIQQKGEL